MCFSLTACKDDETPETYKVTFEENGGSAVADVAGVESGKAIILPTAPSKTGYRFGGWFTDDGTFTNEFTENTKVSANITVYAKWIINSYVVAFDSQGGSEAGSVAATYGGNVAEPTAPTKTGHTFGGWFKEADCINGWNFATDTITANTTLYAKWTAVTYTVTFDSQGGSVISPSIVAYGENAAVPTEPTKVNYAFEGWFKEAACTNPWRFAIDTVTTDKTLFAKWSVSAYVVTFDSRGGSEVSSSTVAVGGNVAEPTAPTREGYTFEGWFKEADCANAWSFATDTVNETTTLYAKWI